MTTTVLIIVLGAAAVGFLVRFFIALCMDRPKEKCHVVHIVRPAVQGSSPLLRPEREQLCEEEEVGSSRDHAWLAGIAVPSMPVRRAR
jgi:hypothetical protein